MNVEFYQNVFFLHQFEMIILFYSFQLLDLQKLIFGETLYILKYKNSESALNINV